MGATQKWTEKQLSRIAGYLAKGLSMRAIQHRYKFDHSTIANYFRKGKHNPSASYILSVAETVVFKKLGYSQILKKYGPRGLYALTLVSKCRIRKGAEGLYQEINKMRTNPEGPASFNAIGRKLGISPEYARQLMSRYSGNYTHASPGQVRYRADLEKLCRLYDAGVKNPDRLSELLNRNIGWVRRELNASGRKLTQLREYTKRDLEVIHNLRKTLPWVKIAAIYDTSTGSVQNFYYNYINGVGGREL